MLLVLLLLLLGTAGSSIGLVLTHHEQQLQHEQRLHLVEWIHKAALQPLWYGGACMTEAQLIEYIVHAVGFNRLASPREQTHSGLQMPSLAFKVTPVAHK